MDARIGHVLLVIFNQLIRAEREEGYDYGTGEMERDVIRFCSIH